MSEPVRPVVARRHGGQKTSSFALYPRIVKGFIVASPCVVGGGTAPPRPARAGRCRPRGGGGGGFNGNCRGETGALGVGGPGRVAGGGGGVPPPQATRSGREFRC